MESLFVGCAVRAALIAGVTAVVLRMIGIKPAAARHTAWAGVMLTMLLLPIWTVWGPKAPIRLLPPVEWRGSIQTPRQNVLPYSVRLTEMRPIQTSEPHRAEQNWTWQSLLLIVYGIGAFGFLSRLAIGMARTHRLRNRANVRDGSGISSECTCPITVGWLHPVVILPKQWQEWPPQQLDAVLTHEREHVRRRDPLIHWLALVNRSLFWFHPLSWWLERKLSVLAEEACDAAVLARGHTPQDYSEYLLDISRSVARSGSRLGIWERRWLEAFFGSESRRFSTRAEHCQSPARGLWLLWPLVQLHPPYWRPACWTTHGHLGPTQAAWFTRQYCKRPGRSRRLSLLRLTRGRTRECCLLKPRQERFLRIQVHHLHRKQCPRHRQIPPKRRDNWKMRFYAVIRLRT